MEESILFERAKDGHYTCQMLFDGQWRYVYSRYEPAKLPPRSIPPNTPILLLGLGLGYELKQLLETTDSDILVVEKHPSFLPLIEQSRLQGILESPRVSLSLGTEYLFHIKEKRCVIASQTTLFDFPYYQTARRTLVNKEAPKIFLFDHPTIASDCQLSFQNLGYQALAIPQQSLEKLLLKALEEAPDYLFTINVSSIPLELAKRTETPYIAWNVDTPVYPVYSDKVKESPNIHIFGYDQQEIESLQKKGFKNTHYLPVAAPGSRVNLPSPKKIMPSTKQPSASSAPPAIIMNITNINLKSAFPPASSKKSTPSFTYSGKALTPSSTNK